MDKRKIRVQILVQEHTLLAEYFSPYNLYTF